MWPNRVSNPGPLTYESGALPTALRGPATGIREKTPIVVGKTHHTCPVDLVPSKIVIFPNLGER